MKLLLMLSTLIMFSSCSSQYSSSSDLLPQDIKNIRFSENTGSSFNEAIVVYGVNSAAEALAAEHSFISKMHGKRGIDWFLMGQTIISQDKKIVDVVEYRLLNPGDSRIIYFDACRFLE